MIEKPCITIPDHEASRSGLETAQLFAVCLTIDPTGALHGFTQFSNDAPEFMALIDWP